MSRDWTKAVDADGETPVSRGLKSGHAATVSLIMHMVESPLPEDDSPFLEAARNSHVEAVREQLELGAYIDETDAYGLTALHWAAINGCMDLAKLLVHRGAIVNPREQELSNLTPMALAKWLGYEALEEFFLENGGVL